MANPNLGTIGRATNAGPPKPRRLLLSIHDVSPRHESQVDALRDCLLDHGAFRMAMLVVPDFWRTAPIVRASPFAARLRRWAERGVEIFLHGYTHRDASSHASRLARFKSRALTAGEAEFLGLDHATAFQRIRDGRHLIEDIIGKPVTGFVAPAWLYGAGAHSAMQAAGIAIAEDHWRVWEPTGGRTLARSPVVTWATRTPARMTSSLLVAAAAKALPLPRIMRVGVHPGDCGEPAVMRSIIATVSALRRSHTVGRYADLREDVPCAS